jgi:exopolysaccharide/PEP-CTERM locus tyrosine autokinase
MVDLDGARTPVGECIRLIKSQLLFNIARTTSSRPSNLIMVTSSLPGEGKTFCATNLAISISMETDRRVLLVDADVARPSVPETLGFDAGAGLMDVLETGVDIAKVIRQTDIENLSVLSAGTPHQRATELLSSGSMGALAQSLADGGGDRIVIFDSPPLLAASEAAVLANHMGQIIVVVEANKTSEKLLTQALERLDRDRIAGLILNKAWVQRRNYGYGHGY